MSKLALVRYNSVFVPLCSPNTCKDVFNPNVTTFQSYCAEGLHFSDFHYYCCCYCYYYCIIIIVIAIFVIIIAISVIIIIVIIIVIIRPSFINVFNGGKSGLVT